MGGKRLKTVLFLLLLLMMGCSGKPTAEDAPSDFSKGRIGVLLGSSLDTYATRTYPDAEIVRIDMTPDLATALKAGACDVAFFTEVLAQPLLESEPALQMGGSLEHISEFAVGFPKNDTDLLPRFNAFLEEIRANGLFDEICRRWLSDKDSVGMMPEILLPSEGKPIRLGTTGLDVPYSFISNNRLAGFDIELAYRFGASVGRSVEITQMNFGGMLPALISGSVDMIANSIMVTEERSAAISFSNPYDSQKSVYLVRREEVRSSFSKDSMWQDLKEAFHRNIVAEDRYLMIIEGLKTTLWISLLSIVLGTILGALVCWMRMSRIRMLEGLASLYVTLMRGTPLLVLLMLMFYVVFAGTRFNAVSVSVMTFALNFAAYASEVFRSSIEGIDRGQTEAGIALGFTRAGTFIHIVLPQAFRRMLPVLEGEVISLVKMTSIVGYIAVQDLTKVGDIIRSRTFYAFFPLIMVAVLYFLLSWLIRLFICKIIPYFVSR